MSRRSRLPAANAEASPVAAPQVHWKPGLEASWRIAIALSVAAVYSNVWTGEFVFDGVPWLGSLLCLRKLWPPEYLELNTRPVVYFTFALDWAIHGGSLPGLHLGNRLIHLGAALTLFELIRRTLATIGTEPRRAAALAGMTAILWAVHPLQTQAVTYLYQRFESLVSWCYLLTLLGVHQAAATSRRRWFILTWLFAAVGMGCKELMATAPLVALWYDRAFLATSWSELIRRRWKLHAGIWATLSVLIGLMIRHAVTGKYRQAGIGDVEGLTPLVYLLNQGPVILHYLRLTVWPSGQCLDPAWPVVHDVAKLLPAYLTIVVLLALCGGAAIRAPRLGFVASFFFMALAPTSTVVPIGDLMFEHRVYLALASPALLFVLSVDAILRRIQPEGDRLRPLIRSTAVAAVALGVVAWNRNQVYHTAADVWRDVTAKSPKHVRGHINLAASLVDPEDETKSRHEEAERHVDLALALPPIPPKYDSHQLAMQILSGIRMQQERWEEAGDVAQRILEQQPLNSDANQHMGLVLRAYGRNDLAKKHLRAAAEGDLESYAKQYEFARILVDLHEYEEAIEVLARAKELAPKHPDVSTLALRIRDALSRR